MNISLSSTKLFGARLSNAIIGFIALAIFAQLVTSTQLGQFFLFQGVVFVLSMISNFGLRNAAVKRISETNEGGQYLSATIIAKAVLMTFAIAIIFIFHDLLNSYVGTEVTVLVSVGIVIREYAQLAISVLEGEHRVGQTAILQLTRQVVWAVLGYTLILNGFKAQGLIFAWLSSHAFVLVWGSLRVSTSLKLPSFNHIYSLLNFSKYQFISSIGGLSYNWIDVLVLGALLSQSAVGAYEIAWRVTNTLTLMASAVATSVFPQTSTWAAENKYRQIGDLVSDTITPSVYLAIPAVFGSFLFAEEGLKILFGAEYLSATWPLVVLTVAQLTQVLYMVFGRSVRAMNKPKISAKFEIVAILFNVCLNLILISQLGLIGAAIGTTFSVFVNAALHYRYLRSFISIQFPIQEMAVLLVAALAMFCLLSIVKMSTSIDSVQSLFLVVIVGAVTYTLVTLIHPRIRSRFHSLMKTFL